MKNVYELRQAKRNENENNTKLDKKKKTQEYSFKQTGISREPISQLVGEYF